MTIIESNIEQAKQAVYDITHLLIDAEQGTNQTLVLALDVALQRAFAEVQYWTNLADRVKELQA